MFAVVLVGGLLLSRATAAPNLCAGLCDESKFGGSSYGHRSSYSSYSSTGGSRGFSSGGLGLGSRGGRLENLDDNVVQTFGGGGQELERPGNWNEEKHFVTDDGHGEMKYKAGQTVTGNGFSKFSEHSYRYGSQDKHVPRADSQILSVSEFNNELQSLRQRIGNFMGSYRSDSGSLVDAGFLRDFHSKASLISSQLNSVCDQVSRGSSQWEQMQRMIKDFERQYEQKTSELQAKYQKHESSFGASSGSFSQSSYHEQQHHESPERPLEPLTKPSIPSESQLRQEQHQQRILSEERIVQQQQQQRLQQKLRTCQDLVREFYREFNKADTSEQYQQQLGTRSELIRERLAELKQEAGQREQQLAEVRTLEAQFGSFVSQLQERIHKFETQQREEEQRYQERVRQLEEDKRRDEERLRQLEVRQEEERREQARLEQQKLQLEQQRVQLERETREKQERLERERIQLEQQRVQIERERSEKQERLERERSQLLQQQRQMEQQLQQPLPTPELPALELRERAGSSSLSESALGSSSATYEASYNLTSASSSSSTMHLEQSSSGSSANLQRQQQQRVLEPHVDMTARVSRLQQDLNRLHNELNAFKIQSARLSSENSVSVVPQLNSRADSLRQEIQSLCDKSERFHSAEALQRAQELKGRFEAEFGRFQSSLTELGSGSSSSLSSQQQRQGGFSSESSWSSSGRIGSVKPPRLTSVELEHSRSVDVEVGSRPAALTGSRSSYSASSGYSSSSSFGSGGSSAASKYSNDCVEAAAGQPCVVDQQHQRYRRHAQEEYGPHFASNNAKTDSFERHQPILNVPPRHGKVSEMSEYRPITVQLKNYLEQQPTSQIGILQLDPHRGNVRVPDLNRASSSNTRYLGGKQINRDDESYRSQTMLPIQGSTEYQRSQMEDLTGERIGRDNYYKPREALNQYTQTTRFRDPNWNQRLQDSSQQTVANSDDDFEQFQKPRSDNTYILTDVRNRVQKPRTKSLIDEGIDQDVRARYDLDREGKKVKDTEFQRIENLAEKPGQWNSRPISTRPEKQLEEISPKPSSSESMELENPRGTVKIEQFDDADSGIPLVHIEESTETTKLDQHTRRTALSDKPTSSRSNGLHTAQNRKSHDQNGEFFPDEISRIAKFNENKERRNFDETGHGVVQEPRSESANFEPFSKTENDRGLMRQSIDITNPNIGIHKKVDNEPFSNDHTSEPNHSNKHSKMNEAVITPASDTEKIRSNHHNINLSGQKMQNLSDYYHHPPQELHVPELSINEETQYPYEHRDPANSENRSRTEHKQLVPIEEPIIEPGFNPTPYYTRSQQGSQFHHIVPQRKNNENVKPEPLRGDLPGISEPTSPESVIDLKVSEIPTQQSTTEMRPETNRYVKENNEDGRGSYSDCYPKQQTERIDLQKYNKEDLDRNTKNEQHYQVSKNNSAGASSTRVYQFNHKSHFQHKYQYSEKTDNYGLGDKDIRPDSFTNRPFIPQSFEKILDKDLESTGNRHQESSMFHQHRFHSSQSQHNEFQSHLESRKFNQDNFPEYYKQIHSSQLQIATPRNHHFTHWFDYLRNTAERKQQIGSGLHGNLFDIKPDREC